MKSIIPGLLAVTVFSVAAVAGEKAGPKEVPTPATQTFECSADLRAKVELAPPGTRKAVAQIWTNDRAVDPMTLRFINEKIGGKTIARMAENCGKDLMNVVFSIAGEGDAVPADVTVTLRGSLVTVR